jgi:hypothetical protein
LPVAANVEPAANISTQRSLTEYVIFGLAYGRWQTLQAFHEHIRQWQTNGRLTRLHLIGPSDKKFDARSNALVGSYPNPDVVVRHGELSSEEVSRLLFQARFAFTTATESNWSKSGTLMAYLAHGCVIIANDRSTVEPLSLAIAPGDVGILSDRELETRGNESRKWYETHLDWRILARNVSDIIESSK